MFYLLISVFNIYGLQVAPNASRRCLIGKLSVQNYHGVHCSSSEAATLLRGRLRLDAWRLASLVQFISEVGSDLRLNMPA